MANEFKTGDMKSSSIGNPKVEGEPTVRNFMAMMQNLQTFPIRYTFKAIFRL